jgi:hypothetical protein
VFVLIALIGASLPAAAQENHFGISMSSVIDALPKPGKDSSINLLRVDVLHSMRNCFLVQYCINAASAADIAPLGADDRSPASSGVSLALVEFLGPGDGVRLVASSLPIVQDADATEMIEECFLFSGFRLDPEKYRLGDGISCFGLRSSWNLDFPGGCHIYNDYLDLFAVIGSEIVHVFSILANREQVGASRMDGELDIWESLSEENRVELLPQATDGFFDLKVVRHLEDNLSEARDAGPDSIREYRWDKATRNYGLRDREND